MKSTQINLKEILQSYQASFETELEELFTDLEQSDSFPAEKLLKSIKYSVLNGGKRLRPILSLVTAEAVLNSEKQLALKENPATLLALAIELVHCGSLIHDDLPCMDDDDMRRGRPSNHKQYDEATALLAGDFLMSYPVELFIKKSHQFFQERPCPSTINACALKLNQATNQMILGQALDMASSDQLEQIQELKTGAVLRASVEIAAVLASEFKHGSFDNNFIQPFIKYANNIGLAFQVADDILDHTQSSEQLGKTAGKDQDQDKTTYIKKYGLDKSREIAQELIDEAKNSLISINKHIYTDKLIAIADYVISRTN